MAIFNRKLLVYQRGNLTINSAHFLNVSRIDKI